jgi:hypothetical protein
VQKVALRRCDVKEVRIYARLPVKELQKDFESSVYMQHSISEDQHSTMDVISNVSIEIIKKVWINCKESNVLFIAEVLCNILI